MGDDRGVGVTGTEVGIMNVGEVGTGVGNSVIRGGVGDGGIAVALVSARAGAGPVVWVAGDTVVLDPHAARARATASNSP